MPNIEVSTEVADHLIWMVVEFSDQMSPFAGDVPKKDQGLQCSDGEFMRSSSVFEWFKSYFSHLFSHLFIP